MRSFNQSFYVSNTLIRPRLKEGQKRQTEKTKKNNTRKYETLKCNTQIKKLKTYTWRYIISNKLHLVCAVRLQDNHCRSAAIEKPYLTVMYNSSKTVGKPILLT